MNNKILSSGLCEAISHSVIQFGEAVTSYADHIRKLIELFNDSTVVQNFYGSGKFGDSQKQRLAALEAGMRRYATVVGTGSDENALAGQTMKYLRRVMELNDSGTTGGSSTGSTVVKTCSGNTING